MANKGMIRACRIEYETKDKTVWKATILAYSIEDALKYIRNAVPAFDRYTSTSVVADIDAIENQVYDDFFVNKSEVVETIVQRDESPSNNAEGSEVKPKCPWCRKEFANNITLGNHIKKFHLEK